MNDVQQLLDSVLVRVGHELRPTLVPENGEHMVPAEYITDTEWLAEQFRLRGERWATDKRRVQATLWWYSASSWLVGPTLTSLALGERVLSADLEDLTLYWLPDSRITGATSSRMLPAGPSVSSAATSLRHLYDHAIPAVAELAGLAERPLWGLAADSIASRLVAIGHAIGEVDDVTALLPLLNDAIGEPLPQADYTRIDGQLRPRRTSCCLIYLAPGQTKCDLCPRRRSRAVDESNRTRFP